MTTTTQPTRIRRASAATLALAALVTATAATAPGALATPTASAAAPAAAERGRLLWAQRADALTASQARDLLGAMGFDASHTRAGVDLWRLTYTTVDPDGRATKASGLVAVPTISPTRLRTVLVEHGTLAYRGDAPSIDTRGFSAAPVIQAAGAGYLAVAPDYLGLGYGPGPHPYFDIPTETSASNDLLAATRQFLPRTRHTLSPDLLIGGFSQGASAALAVARAVQSRPESGWRVRALAPISGAYDISGSEIPAIFSGRVPPPIAVYYVTYLLVAYNRIHHLYADPREVFRTPFAGRVATLFGSNVPEDAILAALPPSLDQLLTPRGLALIKATDGPLAHALRPADRVCDWAPRMPVRLYYVPGDEQVANTNLTACRNQLRAKGINAPAERLPQTPIYGSLHAGSGIAGANEAIAWFAQVAAPQ